MIAIIVVWSDQLAHHGILGQKWGVRRFQNADGTLTAAGRKRYRQILKDQDLDDTSDYVNGMWRNTKYQVKDAGVHIGRKYDKIKKGSKLQRLADDQDVIGDRRKYVSILPEDNKEYETIFDELGIQNLDKAMNYTLATTKDLKVAKGKDVAEYILDRYGSNDIKSAFKLTIDAEYVPVIKYENLKTQEDKDFIGALKESTTRAQKEVNKFFAGKLYKDVDTSTAVLNHYKDLGYDAVIDVEDWGYTDYPLILLDPKNSVSLIESKSLN